MCKLREEVSIPTSVLIRALRCSVKLAVKDKQRVLDRMPELKAFQVTALPEVFINEAKEVAESYQKRPAQVRVLYKEAAKNWEKLKVINPDLYLYG